MNITTASQRRFPQGRGIETRPAGRWRASGCLTGPYRRLDDSFERYLQDKGKGRGGEGGNYRRNAARELERFVEWAAGDRGGGLDWDRPR